MVACEEIFFFCITGKSCILSAVKHLNHSLVKQALSLPAFLSSFPWPSYLQYYCRRVDCTPTLFYINEIILFTAAADKQSAYYFTLQTCINAHCIDVSAAEMLHI